jgi:hypothetical protein
MATVTGSPEIKRLYAIAVRDAADAAGGPRAFAVIGSTYRQALVAREIAGILYRQDEQHVSAERVRELLDGLYGALIEDEELLA